MSLESTVEPTLDSGFLIMTYEERSAPWATERIQQESGSLRNDDADPAALQFHQKPGGERSATTNHDEIGFCNYTERCLDFGGGLRDRFANSRMPAG